MQIVVTERQKQLGPPSFVFLAMMGVAGYFAVQMYPRDPMWLGWGAVALSYMGFSYSSHKEDLLIRIDDTGIFDRRLGIGKISWDDVDDVQLQVSEQGRYLCFRVSNAEPYMARLNQANRNRISYHRSLGFQGFNVDVGPVDVNLLELKKKIDERVRRPV